MENSVKIGLLKDEYLFLQKVYEDFDSRIITIKGWSATIGLAAIGAGFYQTKYLWLFAAFASLIFWCLEATWKSFQYMHGPRIQAIEEAFAAGDFSEIVPLQIYSTWFAVLEAEGVAILGNMCLGLVVLPHGLIVIAGLSLFFLSNAIGLPAMKVP